MTEKSEPVSYDAPVPVAGPAQQVGIVEARTPARRRPLIARTPLWVKLVVALLVLSAVGLLISSVAGGAALRGYLAGRADKQLNATAASVAPQIENRPNLPLNLGPTPTQYFVVEYTATGDVLREMALSEPGIRPVLPALTVDDVVAAAGRPFDVRSADGTIRWRVTTRAFTDGSASVVVALRMEDVDNTLARLRLINLIVGAVVLGLLGLLGFAVVRSSLRPLREVETTAEAIAAGDLSRRVPEGDPGTEVGRLSGALNGMLSQIESAFRAQAMSEAQARASEERMRRFIADASHELRTPLTSIRGFAELYRQGAVSEPAEVERVMRRVEDEAGRMGMLVEDLLLLARLDQQRPLVQQPVDLLAIAADVAHDARALQPHRTVTLTAGDSAGPPVVLGDDARLRQVATNLVTNALVHTPQTAAVAISVGVDGGFAVLQVSDTGPGIPPGDAARVFERFYRADASRTRATAANGSGLGLSIVAALVAAHGGTVHVESAVGVGTTFAVRLPLLGEPVAHPA
ncbi:MAG: phoR [Frankiales bacterium]|nr:phoR [Frankiales bacterium]